MPNVVDTSLFCPSDEKYERFTFIHVSNMVPLKNVEGILSAFKKFLLQTNANAQLIMIGNRSNHYELLAQELNLLNTSVFFRGEVFHPDVAKEMQRCHAFVLNSHIENSPCVIGEALCCGLPVIATAVGGVPELVGTANGLLAPSANEEKLAEAMQRIYQHTNDYITGEIAAAAQEKFSFGAIANLFLKLYGRMSV